jgi:hypothetical protein
MKREPNRSQHESPGIPRPQSSEGRQPPLPVEVNARSPANRRGGAVGLRRRWSGLAGAGVELGQIVVGVTGVDPARRRHRGRRGRSRRGCRRRGRRGGGCLACGAHRAAEVDHHPPGGYRRDRVEHHRPVELFHHVERHCLLAGVVLHEGLGSGRLDGRHPGRADRQAVAAERGGDGRFHSQVSSFTPLS